jgi:hypothetical protein
MTDVQSGRKVLLDRGDRLIGSAKYVRIASSCSAMRTLVP